MSLWTAVWWAFKQLKTVSVKASLANWAQELWRLLGLLLFYVLLIKKKNIILSFLPRYRKTWSSLGPRVPWILEIIWDYLLFIFSRVVLPVFVYSRPLLFPADSVTEACKRSNIKHLKLAPSSLPPVWVSQHYLVVCPRRQLCVIWRAR